MTVTFRSVLAALSGPAIAGFALAAPALVHSAQTARKRGRLAFSHGLPRLDGRRLQVKLVDVAYAPGESSAPHTHPCPIVGYVLEGAVRMRVSGSVEAIYKAGEGFYEEANGRHLVSANVSRTERVARPANGGAYWNDVVWRHGHISTRASHWGGVLVGRRVPLRAAEVNAFMPSVTIPFLAWAATAAELSVGIALIVGFQTRWVAFGSAFLLALFGAAMAVSLGIKSPMDYSVFSASAAALLLALSRTRESDARVARTLNE